MSVRYALLGLLEQKPRHGYELLHAFTAVVGGAQNWDVKPAQIYTTLNRLKDGGLIIEERVEQDGGPEKHIYSITEVGKEELHKWFFTPIITTYRRDEFFIKLMICLATGRDPMKMLYLQRSSLYKELHDLNNQRLKADPQTELGHVLLLEQAIMHTEADLRWLDMIEVRMDELKRQPLPEAEPKIRGRPPKQR